MKKVISILIVIIFACTSVFAVTVPSDGDLTSLSGGGTATGSTEVTDVAGGIWQTVATLVQILAVAAVVFAGVRYMFASADAKADIKKQTVILIIGAVLVFGATTILQVVSNAADQIL